MGNCAMTMRRSYRQQGFTLVELAIVLVIIGVLLGSFLTTLSSRIEMTRKSEVVTDLEDIKQAMMAYAFVNGSLPCPDCDVVAGNCLAADINDGVADFVGAACNEAQRTGNVPWVTLGLGHSDSWGIRYRYAVQGAYANSAAPFTLNSAAGTAVIQEPDFVANDDGSVPKALANNIVAIILSQGKNGYGGISENNVARDVVPVANIDETNNTNDDQFYYMRSQTDVGATIAGGEFDDIVIWISEYELKAKMVQAGALP